VTQEDIRIRFWKKLIAGVVIGSAAFLVLSVGGIALYRHRQHRAAAAEIIVPNLKGLDLKTAESQARQSQLNPQIMLRRWDIPAPIGTIVGQIPEPGISVPVNSTIGFEVCIEDPSKPQTEKKKP